MARLPQASGDELVRALVRAGYEVVAQRGSHVKLRRADRTLTVPLHGSKPLKKGTLRAILRDAGLSASQLAELL